MREVHRVEVESGIEQRVWLCADDVDQEGHRFSRFCQRVRGISPEEA